MSTVRQILRLLGRGKSMQAITEMTGVSRNTLRKYQARFKASGFGIDELLQLSDKDLHDLFLRTPELQPNPKVQELYAMMPHFEKELKKRGVTKHLLWLEYRALHPDGFLSSQFRNYLNAWLKHSQPTMHVEHKVGHKMYVDFTGEKLHIIEPTTGEVGDVEVFVSILGASQLIYIEAVLSQNKEDFIHACRNAVEYYGGSPEAIVPDNLRSAVTKSNKFEPEINRSFDDFASHYGMSVLPARVYRRRDKALVEGAVKIVYQRVFAHIRNERFHALDELNVALRFHLEALNVAPFKDRSYSRRQLFEEIERDVLAPLPRIRYELRTESRATVMKNGHVVLSTDKHYYSVPHTIIGLKVKLLHTRTTVDIYYQHQCVASHVRSRRPYGYTTDKDHLASTHRFVTDWSKEKFLAWGSGIGADIRDYLERIFQLAQHPEQAYRSCLGILNMAGKVGNQRLNKACRRASEYGTYSYGSIRKILERGLDHDPADDAATGNIPDHDNIRGREHYGRNHSSNNLNEGDIT